MNTAAIKKTEIIRELSLIPDHKLDNIRKYIESVLQESSKTTRHNRSLKGIWQDTGLAEIADLEAELKEAKKEIEHSILRRKF